MKRRRSGGGLVVLAAVLLLAGCGSQTNTLAPHAPAAKSIDSLWWWVLGGCSFGLAFVTGAFLRQHYAAPLTSTNPNVNIHGWWLISQQWTRHGQPASLSMINQTLRAIDIQAVTLGQFQPGPAAKASINPVNYLVQHGYALLTTYQPASRFWPFQWIEGSWLLALSLLLITATVWLVRRRAA